MRTAARALLAVFGVVLFAVSAAPALALPIGFRPSAPVAAAEPETADGTFFSTGFRELEATAAVLGAGGVVADTAALLAPTQADVAAPRCAPAGNQPAYSLALRALTGADGADLTLRLRPLATGCAPPAELAKVQLKTFALDGSVEGVRTLTDLPTVAGRATVDLGLLRRGQHVAAGLLVQTETPGRTYFLRRQTTALLRPRLTVTAVKAPPHVLTGRPVVVEVSVAERNRDVGARARVSVAVAGTVVGISRRIGVPAGGRASVKVPVRLPSSGSARLDVAIGSSLPREAVSGTPGHATIQVADFALDRSRVLVPRLAGYGSQFNHHVYAQISQDVGVTPENVLDMEQKVMTLGPQFVRVFFHPSAFTHADRMESFVRTVLVAQHAGATIDVTWQGGRLDVKSGTIPKFADVLVDLVQNRGVTNLRWLTLQNEPNSTRMTPHQYEAMYRELDPYLTPVRDQIRYLGGDLVGTVSPLGQTQDDWFRYLARHMGDLLDAWSIHVFWDYGDTAKLQRRLTEVRTIVDALPRRSRRPVYVTEYGVRGSRTFDGAAQIEPGVWSDGTPLSQTNISAFQHAWFDILSARLGYRGTSSWDSYFGKYDSGSQAYWMIGRPQDGWPLEPTYHVLHLLTSTTKPGWKVVGLDGASGSKLVTAYAGPDGDLTVIGLDTSGAQLNAASATQVAYRVAGLPPRTYFRLEVWNRDGDGKNVEADPVLADAAGVATVTVPLQSVFALTTLPAS